MLTRCYAKTISSSIKVWLSTEAKQIRLFTKSNDVHSFTLAGPQSVQPRQKTFGVFKTKENKEKTKTQTQANEKNGNVTQKAKHPSNLKQNTKTVQSEQDKFSLRHDPFKFANSILDKKYYLTWENQTAQLVILLNRLAKIPVSNNDLKTQRKSIAKNIINLCMPNFDKMNRLDVIMFLWASVKLNVYNKKVLEACLGYIEPNFSELLEQDVSNYMYCLAKIADETNQNLKEIISKHLQKMNTNILPAVKKILSSSNNEQHITNLVWAAERLELKELVESKEFSEVFLIRKVNFNNINFGIIVNSLTRMKFNSVEMFERFGQEFIERLNTFTLQEFISIIRAFCLSNAINLYDLLSSAEPYIEKHLTEFSHEELTAILVAFALVKLESPLVDTLIDQVHQSVEQMSLDCLCKVIWSLAILRGSQHMGFEMLMLSRFPNEEIKKMRRIDLTQAAQGLLSYLLFAQESGLNNSQITALQEKYEIMKSLITKNILVERHQEFSEKASGIFSVYQTLQSLELEVIPESIAEIYSIDFGLMNITEDKLKDLKQKLLEDKLVLTNNVPEIPPQKTEEQLLNIQKDKSNIILLEINGKHHYVGKTFRLKGSTIRKKEQLRKMGYKVVFLSTKKCTMLSELPSNRERALALLDIMLEEAYNPTDE